MIFSTLMYIDSVLYIKNFQHKIMISAEEVAYQFMIANIYCFFKKKLTVIQIYISLSRINKIFMEI